MDMCRCMESTNTVMLYDPPFLGSLSISRTVTCMHSKCMHQKCVICMPLQCMHMGRLPLTSASPSSSCQVLTADRPPAVHDAYRRQTDNKYQTCVMRHASSCRQSGHIFSSYPYPACMYLPAQWHSALTRHLPYAQLTIPAHSVELFASCHAFSFSCSACPTHVCPPPQATLVPAARSRPMCRAHADITHPRTPPPPPPIVVAATAMLTGGGLFNASSRAT